MKILTLNLKAYGPFTNELLEFGNGTPAMHVVYGPNEAGKSSALRALRSFFYGIETRSSDNFLHPYPKLRIEATLQTVDGRVLQFTRRKGQKNTLRDGNDDKPVDETVLSTLLGGVDETSFARRYGIGYDDLVQGGRDLVTGGGDLGQSLFGAASGVANLSAARAQLIAESEKLFKNRGSNPEVNRTVAQLSERQRQIRVDLLPTARWREHDRAFHDALKRREMVNRQAGEQSARLTLLERIVKAIPIAARYRQLQEELTPLANVPLLSEDFAEMRREASTALQVAAKTAEETADEMEQLRKSLEELEFPAEVLQHGATVTQLQQRLGSHLKAMEDRRVRVAERNAAVAAARIKLKELGRVAMELDQVDQLHLKREDHVRISNLGNEKGKLVARVESAREQLDDLSEQLEDVGRQMAAAPPQRDAAAMQTALTQAREAGPLEKQLAEFCRQQQAAEDDATIALGQLYDWKGTLAELETLALPALETIDRYETKLSESAADLKSLHEKRDEAAEESRQLAEQIERIRREHDVPTEDDLATARAHRDDKFSALQQHRAEGNSDEAELAAYRERVARADQIADRLRREAKAVAEKAQLLARDETVAQRLKLLADLQQKAEATSAERKEQWMSLWTPLKINPRSPREMRAWLRQAEAIREAAAEQRARQRDIASFQKQIEVLRTALSAALADAGRPPARDDDSLAQLTRQAEAEIERIEEEHRQRNQWVAQQKQLQGELDKGRRALAKSTNELTHWGDQWQQAVAMLQLREGAEPAEAAAAMEVINELLRYHEKASDLERRITSIDEDAAEFTDEVQQLCAVVAPKLAGETVERAVPQLADLLTAARTTDTQRTEVEKQLTAAQQRSADAKRDSQKAAALLDALCAEAASEKPEDLPAAERDSARRRELERELRDKSEQLTELAAGQTLDNFLNEVAQSEVGQVDQEIRELKAELRTLADELSELDQTIGEERIQLAQMDGNARAAEARQEAEGLLAKIRADAQQYARLRMAEVVLAAAIERYRQRHEGPVMQRASELFATLTRGGFTALRADLDDANRPVLVGVRGGTGEKVHVGGMSDGTCDQLYLALRIASLETEFASGEPLPFVVDDILIKFDDDRAAATLKVLAALAEKTQVILFTHHEHLVRLAEDVLDGEVVTHALDSRRQLAGV